MQPDAGRLTALGAAPRPGRGRAVTVGGLLALTLCCVLLAVCVDLVFVHTAAGQRADDGALSGSVIGRDRVIGNVQRLLNLVSVSALIAATVLVALVATVRRHLGLGALAVVLLAGANVTTEILKKQLLHRPDLGVDGLLVTTMNTLPSGHTTVAMSVSIALLLVVPPALKSMVAVLGGLGSAAMGIATLSAGWHRPSDAVAAYFVVGAWAAGLAAMFVLTGAAGQAPLRRRLPVTVLSLLVTAGLAAWAIGCAALFTANSQDGIAGRRRLFADYAGGAALTAGTALVVTAALLVVAHVIADHPHRPRRLSAPAGSTLAPLCGPN